MTVVITDFERPDPNLEYEVIEDDPHSPVITPRTVNCCTCPAGNTSLCQPEQTQGTSLAASAGWFFAHLFAS